MAAAQWPPNSCASIAWLCNWFWHQPTADSDSMNWNFAPLRPENSDSNVINFSLCARCTAGQKDPGRPAQAPAGRREGTSGRQGAGCWAGLGPRRPAAEPRRAATPRATRPSTKREEHVRNNFNLHGLLVAPAGSLIGANDVGDVARERPLSDNVGDSSALSSSDMLVVDLLKDSPPPIPPPPLRTQRERAVATGV